MADLDESYPPPYWRDRADEARAKAKNMVSEQGRRWMLEIAALYDKLTATKPPSGKPRKRSGANQTRMLPPGHGLEPFLLSMVWPQLATDEPQHFSTA